MVVVRLGEVCPILAELESAAITPVKTENDLPVYNYSAIQHLVKTGMAHECYSLNAFIYLTDKKLHDAFTTGCLELDFSPVVGRVGSRIEVYDKVATFTDLQSLLPDFVKRYEVIMDIPHNLSVESGNYARKLVCNN